ncbi:LOW QUALITY PROTEIN: serine/arginine repetitive matrix protein 2-like [Saccostrea cucullata]|uniref:LOW QUALITY PROTEIN: serine/arginine repetitive matrix protein 2-like n=1 Tax=Saccostrea cuccullata TaxID=36930 RepID=UPI002ED1C3BE
MTNRQVWFSLPIDPWIEDNCEEFSTRSLESQFSVSSLSQQTTRSREINRLNYCQSINQGPVPRLNLNLQENTHSIHTFNLSARSSLSAYSDRLSQVSIELESASLSQISLEDTNSSNYHSVEGLEVTKVKDIHHANDAGVKYTINNMENNGRSSIDSGAMNQTGSTNDSHNGDSSRASPLRGLSSDEGSGWKSETTENSDGNLSLSQYAIGGDHSEEDSPQNSVQEEFLTSAISEVSKDFISGNFSPSKYPGASAESDSLSDGDNQGHLSGAVYARYPESATGMSDCEWNPYATESDTNHTPRSNASEAITASAAIPTIAPLKDNEFMAKEDRLEEIYAQQLSRNNSSTKRNSPPSPSAKSSDSGNGSVKSSLKEEDLSHHQPSASYVLYSTEVKSTSSQGKISASESDSTVRASEGSSNSDSDKLSSNSFIPISYKASKSDSQVPHQRPEPLGGRSDECLYAKRTTSCDPVRAAVSRGGSDFRMTDSEGYLPVDERSKLLSKPQSFDPPMKKSDLQTKSQGGRSTEPLDVSQGLEEDALSQRVAKLLNSANELGSSLHQSLYSKEALGMSDREDFPKYKFSPVRSQYPGLSTPSPTMGNSTQEDLTKSAKSMASDASLRSSLGEEVAKLLARTENIPGNKHSEDVSAASEPSSKTFIPIPQETQADIEPNSRNKKTAANGHARHESEDSQKSEDSLDHKVKEILQRTSYVEKKQVPRKVDPSALDYSRLQKDLQEIQNSLPVHLNQDNSLDVTGEKETFGDSLKVSEKSFVSEAESAQSGGKKLLWDHGADLGYEDSERFLGTMKSDTETMEASPGSVNRSYESSGKSSQKTKDESTEKDDTSDVVSDQLEVEIDEIRIGNVAPDVEEIIAKYQKKSGPALMEPQFEEDTTGLANRVFQILTTDHPQKQATGILERVVKEEGKLIQKMAELPKLDSSYDGYNLPSADSSFAPRDKDIRKQLEWSEMSSLDYGHPDKTGLSEMSFKTGLPFSALGNAKTFLSSQLQKMSDQTFNHSIELRTPYRNVVECYTVYGTEQKGASKEAWPPEDKQGRQSETGQGREPRADRNRREIDPLSNERFFLNSLDTTPVELRPRRYSDPRELSPEGWRSREGHSRSKSEDSKSILPDSDLQRDMSRPLTSSSSIGGARPKNMLSSGQRLEGHSDGTPPIGRRKPYKPKLKDSSPGSGMSPGDSDVSNSSASHRRDGPKLRPYRSVIYSYILLYNILTGPLADSVTTLESTHTVSLRRVLRGTRTSRIRGSDDAVGPYIPSQHLGSRQDGPRSSGIYGNRSNLDVVEDALSTIEEKSISDDRERAMSDLANPLSDFYKRDSGLEHSSRVPMATDRAPSVGSDHFSNRSGSSRASNHLQSHDQSTGLHSSQPHSSEGGRNFDNFYEDSRMSMTTRSDPGDQFATPRRVRDVSTISGQQAHISRENSSDNLVKSKSRSETDLVAMSPEGRQISSSPASRGRLMDMSAQPSPILSYPNSLISPAFQGAVRELNEADKILNQIFGPESNSDLLDTNGRKGGSDRESDRNPMVRDVPYSSRRPAEDEYSRTNVQSRQPQEEVRRREDYGSRRSPVDDYSRGAVVQGRQPPEEISRREDYGSRGQVDDVNERRRDRDDGRPLERRSGDDRLLSEDRGRKSPGERPEEIQPEYVRSRPQGEEVYEYTKKEDKLDRATPNQYDSLGDIMKQYQSRPLEPGRESLDYDSRPRSTDPGRDGYTVSAASTRPAYYPSRGNIGSRSDRLQDVDIPRTSAYSRPIEDDNIRLDRRQDTEIPPKSSYAVESSYSTRPAEIVSSENIAQDRPRSFESRPLEPGSDLYQSRAAVESSGFYSGRSDSDKEYKRVSPLEPGRGLESRSLETGGDLLYRLGREDTLSQPLEPGRGLISQPLDMVTDLPYRSGSDLYQQKSVTDHDPYKSSSADLLETVTRQALDDVSANQERPKVDKHDYIERERGRSLDRGQDYLDMFIPRAIDRETRRDWSDERRSEGQRSRERSSERLNRSRSPANKSSEKELREYVVDGEIFTELPQVPDEEFEDMVRTERLKAKKELELMRKMKRPKGHILSEEEEKEFGAEFDSVPPSKKAQALRETLERDRDPSLPANINDLWKKFQEMNETQSDSSMNTSRMETLTSLLRNPTKHVVQRALDDRTYQKVKERRVVQELADMELESQGKEGDSRPREGEKWRMEKQKRRQTLSEEESNGSYAEILAKQKKTAETEKRQKNKENKMKGSKSVRVQDVKKCESADTLYSIPEDTSFESSRGASPSVLTESQKKAKKHRQKNVIDPLMVKLKEKVETQKNKIDVERRKEMKRLEKLKKLEMLLGAKKKGKLSDKAISAELENVSTTSVPQSDESSTFLPSDSTLMEDSGDSTRPVLDSTSSKDSSIELQRTRVRKSKDNRDFQKSSSAAILLEDSESQSDIIVIRKPKTKQKKDKLNDEVGHRSRDRKKHRDEELSSAREKFHLETSPVRTRKLRDIGTMYPSPIVVSPPTMRRRPKEVAMKSEAVQTTGRNASPSYSNTMVIPVPLMSPESQRKSKSARSSRVEKHHSQKGPHQEWSPDRSSLSHRSYTPPRAKSPSSKLSGGQRVKSTSPGTQFTSHQRIGSTSPPRSRMFVPESDSEYEKFIMKTPPKNKMFTPETPEDEYAARMRDSPRGMAWYIPMDKEVKPWRKPLKEQQAHAVRNEPWQPKNVSSSQWKNIVNSDIMNKSRDTKFDLNPEGEPIENKENTMEESDDDNSESKPLNKMSLQEAFKLYKQNTISHVRERQKRVTLATEERRLVTAMEAERERLFAEQKKKEANPDAHPYSENLHVPKRERERREIGTLTKQEIKERTKKSYKKLAEVVEKKKEEKRQEDYALNRLKAKVFNRRIQRHVLKKSATLR